MARRKTKGGEELVSPAGNAAELAADEAMAAGAPHAQGLPTLQAPQHGKAEEDVDPPIPVFIRDAHGGLRPGRIIGLECHGRLSSGKDPKHGRGQARAAKGIGETIYRVQRADPQMNPEDRPTGTFSARQLCTPEQAHDDMRATLDA